MKEQNKGKSQKDAGMLSREAVWQIGLEHGSGAWRLYFFIL